MGLSTLETRAMSRLSTPLGRMLIVAADQRNSMKAVMVDDPSEAAQVSTQQLIEAKYDLVTGLGNYAPAILLDPETAVPGVVDDGVLASDTALVVGMDASGFETVGDLRYTKLVPGISVKKVRELGGDAAKMLWYMRPDIQDETDRVAQEIRELTAACHDQGVLLIVEILTYKLPDETQGEFQEKLGDLVADSAALSVACGARVLKMQYPGSAAACALVTSKAAGVPWAVLSAGVNHETFIKQVRTAVQNGAAGAMAGRSLWKDALSTSHEVRAGRLESLAKPRLEELREAVDTE